MTDILTEYPPQSTITPPPTVTVITYPPATSTPDLPATGGSIGDLIVPALILLALGIAAIFTARRIPKEEA